MGLGFCCCLFDLTLFYASFGRYCIADDRLVNGVEFLDLGNGAGWELLQVIYMSFSPATISECL